MTQSADLSSIWELRPLDSGGRIARKGFGYQDHVAVSLCLELLTSAELEEVWCETHDDVTLIWRRDHGPQVEFVQVKAEDLSSRWSVAELIKREKAKGGKAKPWTSVIERSLERARCRETVCFRMVTSVDVDQELSVLKLVLGHPDRTPASLTSLQDAIDGRLPGIVSGNGTTTRDWVALCYWDKRDSPDGTRSQNVLRLDRILHDDGHWISPDHRDELYQGLLALVHEASCTERAQNPNAHRLSGESFKASIIQKLRTLGYGGPPGVPEGLRDRMERCGIALDVIETAAELRHAYRRATIEPGYSSGNALRTMKIEVAARLQMLVADLDAGVLDESGPAFHAHCLRELHSIRADWPDDDSRPSLALLQGYMYERTHRQIHRFDRAQP